MKMKIEKWILLFILLGNADLVLALNFNNDCDTVGEVQTNLA